MPIFSKSSIPQDSKSIENWVQEQYMQTVTALHDLRQSSVKWYDLVRGDMITPSETESLKAKGLQALKLNIVLPKIVRVLGAERDTRAGIKAVPLRGGKLDTAKALTKLFEMIRVNSDGFRETKDAWLDSVIADLPGWLEVVWTNDNDPLGQPIYRSVNPMNVLWDLKSDRYDLSDARFVMKSWWSTADDAIRDFPEKGSEIKREFPNHGFISNIVSSVQDFWPVTLGPQANIENQFINRKENLIRMIEAQVRENVTETRLFDPETQTVERPDNKEELLAIKERFPRLIEVDFKWDKIKIVTTAGHTLLLQDVEADVQNGMFSLIPFWAFVFRGKPFGLVHNLEGPQELFWKEMSSALHITNTLANPIWMVPKDSLTESGMKRLQKYSARTGFILEYDVVAGQKPTRESNNTVPLGKLQLANTAQLVADRVTGLGPNSTGQSDTPNESGKLVDTRIAESLTMLDTLFDNKMKSTTILHNYLIGLIQAKMTAMRIVRYIGDSNSPQELIINQVTAHGILNDMKQGEYGVAIEKGDAKFFRQEKFIKLMLLANQIGANPVIIKMLINTFDEIDQSEKDELIQSVEAQALEPQLMQMETEIRNQAQARTGAGIKQQEVETKRIAAEAKSTQRAAA